MSPAESCLHVLLIDVRAPSRPALALALRKEHRVTVVQTIEEGLEVLKHDPPAMIILDAGEQNMIKRSHCSSLESILTRSTKRRVSGKARSRCGWNTPLLHGNCIKKSLIWIGRKSALNNLAIL